MLSSEGPAAKDHFRLQGSEGVTAEKASVLQQLSLILSSPLFNKSKRCGPFLKYIVTETLDGRGDQLKERSIGIDVFRRPPDYDTNEDRIVRAAAIDLRRRIAQYYQDPEHADELRIEVPSGSYVPRFLPLMQAQTRSRNEVTQSDALPSESSSPETNQAENTVLREQTKVRLIRRTALVCLAVAIAIGIWFLGLRAKDPIKTFWAPMLRSEKVIIVLGNESNPADAKSEAARPAGPSFFDAVNSDRVAFADSVTASRITALLGALGKAYEVRRGGAMTLHAMRESPSVIIGALSNPWALTLQQQLRYQFRVDESAHTLALVDQTDAAHPLWKIDWTTPYSDLKEDRAIISRFVDPHTGQPVVLIAGLGRDGTASAGEFVTNAAFLKTLMKRAPKNWEGNNLQAVIATDIVNGRDGVPHVVTVYYW